MPSSYCKPVAREYLKWDGTTKDADLIVHRLNVTNPDYKYVYQITHYYHDKTTSIPLLRICLSPGTDTVVFEMAANESFLIRDDQMIYGFRYISAQNFTLLYEDVG